MTDEELDALERSLSLGWGNPVDPRDNQMAVLIEELRAARAERDALAAIVDMAGEWPKAMARANAAETRIFALEQEKEAIASLGLKQWSRAERAEAAEAELAEAYEELDRLAGALMAAEASIAFAKHMLNGGHPHDY